jgi:citrate lyase subunit alpha/citrate CoA-transferase
MVTICKTFEEFYKKVDIHSKKNISFHHHLRNGDAVLNTVLGYYVKENVQQINLFPSAIFPSYLAILDLLKNKQINDITTNYMNGPVAEYISENGLIGTLKMQTHGGRARAIEEGLSKIDIAYIAVPYCDMLGNAVGYKGINKCGSLGYAIPDSEYANTVVLVTDKLVEETISNPEIFAKNVDYIVVVDSIGDKEGIVSGTTQITTNPIGVKIAKNTSRLLEELGMIKEGFSFQSGAGGVSLRVTKDVRDIMKQNQIKASFFSGGITKYHVDMLEEGLVEKLYDVQCFDLVAVESLNRNNNHIPIGASRYANPINENQVIKDLDIVILGAAEIDLEFNVNVTTDSHGTIFGGSGGHSDTATESKLCVIVSPLIKGRLPIIKDKVTTITTLGKNVDCFVTERGIAINPCRTDLIQALEHSKLPIMSISDLQQVAHKFTNIPKNIKNSGKIIGVVEDRTLDIIDSLYQK